MKPCTSILGVFYSLGYQRETTPSGWSHPGDMRHIDMSLQGHIDMNPFSNSGRSFAAIDTRFCAFHPQAKSTKKAVFHKCTSLSQMNVARQWIRDTVCD